MSSPPTPPLTDSTPQVDEALLAPYHGRKVAQTIKQIYHEQQTSQHCAVHTINNILQRRAFTTKDFDEIAMQCSPDSWVNPHKSIFGTGNYDANVLLAALSIHSGLPTTWFNRKKQRLASLDTSKLAGIIINVISSSFLWWETRHWLPLVPIMYQRPPTAEQPEEQPLKELWFNLNPCLDDPTKVDLIPYLEAFEKKDKDAIFIFVLLPGVKDNEIWLPQ